MRRTLARPSATGGVPSPPGEPCNSDLPVALKISVTASSSPRGDPAYPHSLDEAVELLRKAAGSDPDPRELPRILRRGPCAAGPLRERGRDGRADRSPSLQESAVALTAPTASFRSVRLGTRRAPCRPWARRAGCGSGRAAARIRGQAGELFVPGAHEPEALYLSLAAMHVEAITSPGTSFTRMRRRQ